MLKNSPVKIKSARAWRTYLGGKLIDELHGCENPQDSNFPEEWLMSTVRARNVGRENIVEGLSITEYGNSLKEMIDSAPKKILGAEHYKTFGNTTGVLVKLLDSMERLTVQVHPTRQKAKELFKSEYGKTECWHIIGCRETNGEKPCIYLGFREGVTREIWKECFDRQDITAMLNCLHKIEVKAGDTYLIRGGVPHAIGAGCFLVEIQEPTDYTIRTEKTTPLGLKIDDYMCHQGLGFEKMFDCFEYDALSYEETVKRAGIIPETKCEKGTTVTEVVGYKDTSMFRLFTIEIKEDYIFNSLKVFSGLYVLSGSGILAGKAVTKGDQFFVPADTKKFSIIKTGNEPLKLLWYFGPDCSVKEEIK